MTLVFDGPKAFCIGRRTLLSCILLGIICQGTFNILYSMSISMNGMSVGSVLLYTAPIFTSITSMLLFKEKMTLLKWVALLVNVIGCALTATGGDFSAASLDPLGLLIGVGAGFTYAMTAVINTKISFSHFISLLIHTNLICQCFSPINCRGFIVESGV